MEICHLDKSQLPEECKHIVIKCVEAALWLPLFLERKNISLHRLRLMIFGKGYKKTTPIVSGKQQPNDASKTPEKSVKEAQAVTPPADTQSPTSSEEAATSVSSDLPSEALPEMEPPADVLKKPGHGRLSHTAYTADEEIRLQLFITRLQKI